MTHSHDCVLLLLPILLLSAHLPPESRPRAVFCVGVFLVCVQPHFLAQIGVLPRLLAVRALHFHPLLIPFAQFAALCGLFGLTMRAASRRDEVMPEVSQPPAAEPIARQAA
jgi:hypothetical protein